MDRLLIIETLVKEKKLNNYLEIGVFNGHIFFRVKSDFKVAVDPEFRFDTSRRIGKTLLNPYNLYNRYFSKTSDEFFEQDAAKVFGSRKIEISLVDGMHEYAYALRDVENVLKYLTDDGVIIMHDCNALTKDSACSFAEWKARDFAGTWNGDVWKVILHMQSLRPDVHAMVLDCDHGLGIITRQPTAPKFSFTSEQIDAFTYEEFDQNRNAWLNLKPAEYFYEYFGIRKKAVS